MDYIAHTPKETSEMLKTLGLEKEEDLFNMIPQALRNPQISLPKALTEMEITGVIEAASNENTGSKMVSFLGGGAYDHFIPQAVPALISRGDFNTAYTPYQAEASQGTLQAIYEFQTLMCRLTGLEVANASMYDGATALGEAALMACRIKRKEKVIVSNTINPHYRRVLRTYLGPPGIDIVEIPHKDGIMDQDCLREALDKEVAAVFMQYPNYYGILESSQSVADIVQEIGCLFGVVVYPHSLGILQPPGKWNADIVIGDLQSLGLSLHYGGPYAGFIAAKNKYVRQLPGRLAGRTTDADGQTGYVLTLQTREQHIRRARATSNICTNQALCALAATIYLTLMGPKGIRRAAELSARKAHELHSQLCKLNGVKPVFDRPFFNEFVIEIPIPVEDWLEHTRKQNLLAGIRIPAGEICENEALLVCTTEKNTTENIDQYVNALSGMLK